MKRSFALALILLASVDGFASDSVSRVAAVHRTKVAEIRKTNVEIISKDALRWAAVNVIAPALLASSVLIGDMGIACAADGAVVTSPTENYLPRRLYPGTYQNYCGPTPEVQVKGGCIAHGWYGDAPADLVDAACEQHDVAYCNCETKLLQRKRTKRLHVSPAQEIQQQSSNDDEESIPLLASMVALRFATRPALQVTPTIQADAEYFDCVHRADQEIIATGIRIRGEQQRAGCSTDPSLAWFCDMSGKGTLAAFEKVNLSIFLRDLDNDGDGGKDSSDIDASRWAVFRTKPSEKKSSARETLAQIEYRRENDIMRRLQSGVSVSEAASSEDVMADEEKLLSKLTAGGAY